MEIKEKGEFKVVGLEIETTVQECMNNNPHTKLWEEFMKQVWKIKNRAGPEFYGVCISINEKECKFKSIACVEVSSLDNIPEGMVGEIVPASKYAVYEHKGKISGISDTYAKLYEEEMPKSGLKQKEVWLEVYDERYKHESDDSIMEIWCSVE